MTVAERRNVSGAQWREFAVSRLSDRETIHRILDERRPYAAYALGQLDPRLFHLTEWWLSQGGDTEALVLHSSGGLGKAAFMAGETQALDAILRIHPGPRSTFLTCEQHHLETVTRHFELHQRQVMMRMQVTPATFKRCEGIDVRRLDGGDARRINSLYRSDGVPSFYQPRQIEDAVYFGAERDGRLIAIAGTHVVSSSSAIAVVGNVYTHPTYRGQHLAQATTSAVTEQLLRFCREVVLSVDPENAAAVRAYERLGYTEVARLIEGAAVRRDVAGFMTATRRLIAGARGKKQNREIVRLRA